MYCSPLGTLSGSVLQDAVEAVDNAAALLLCLTQDFVDDLTCRSLVAMATKLNVHIIPVVMSHQGITGWVADEVTPK